VAHDPVSLRPESQIVQLKMTKTMGDQDDIYARIAGDLPNDVGIGGGLIGLVEPDPGHERIYNRYYEDDHFYAGAMAGPWVISGRRWVATRDLLASRYEPRRPLIEPPGSGCFLATYLHMAGHARDVARWGTTSMNEYLYPRGRGYSARENIYTSYSTYEFATKRDPDSPLRPYHALDHRFEGVVLEILEPDRAMERSDVIAELKSHVVPGLIRGTACSLVLAFTPQPLPPNPAIPKRRPVIGAGWNLTLLSLLDDSPRQSPPDFARHARAFAEGNAELRFAAAFLPTEPGSDRYIDEIR
jgi:hypothetical protein